MSLLLQSVLLLKHSGSTMVIFPNSKSLEFDELNCYTVCYEKALSLPGQKEWPDTTLLPLIPWPENTKKVGRPLKHARRKEPDEGGHKKMTLKYSCSNCGVLGHNKKGCKQPLTNQNVAYSTASTKQSKLPVKKKVGKSYSGSMGSRTTTQEPSSLVATKIYKMDSNTFVTQQSDGNSTVTRLYN